MKKYGTLKISTLDLSYVITVKSTMEILQNFVGFMYELYVVKKCPEMQK